MANIKKNDAAEDEGTPEGKGDAEDTEKPEEGKTIEQRLKEIDEKIAFAKEKEKIEAEKKRDAEFDSRKT